MENTKIYHKLVNNCNNCWKSIGEDEVIYRVLINQKIIASEKAKWKNSVGIGNIKSNGEITETWIQCGACYLQWQKELEDGKARPINWWLWGTLLYLILVVSAVFSYEGHSRGGNTLRLFGGIGISERVVIIPIIFLLSLLTVILIYLIFRRKPVVVNRFKLRKK